MEERQGPSVYGVIVGCLYVLGVGVQVWIVMDEVTHGALSGDVKRRWRKLRAQIEERRRIDREVAEAVPWVLWEAHTAIEDGEAQ